jgi:hypothetical protein
MRFCRPIVLIVAVLCTATPRSFAATEAEKQARRSFERAETHFKAGLYGEALTEYQDGYERLPLPGFLINIAQCQRRLGDLVSAQATYRKFILIAPDSPYVPEVKALVAEIDKLIASEQSTSPARAAGKEGLSPPPVAAAVPQPEPSGAQSAALVTAPVHNPPPPRTGTRWWLWGTVGGAVAVGVVTAVLLSRSPDNTVIHDGSIGTLRR